jgi:hypothetical protein
MQGSMAALTVDYSHLGIDEGALHIFSRFSLRVCGLPNLKDRDVGKVTRIHFRLIVNGWAILHVCLL